MIENSCNKKRPPRLTKSNRKNRKSANSASTASSGAPLTGYRAGAIELNFVPRVVRKPLEQRVERRSVAKYLELVRDDDGYSLPR